MVMLHRKLFRELLLMKGQAIAIALIIASAVASYVTMRGAYESLVVMRDRYYREYRFADVFASLERAPESAALRIRQLPGVAEVETRAAAEVILDVPGLEDPASGRMLSLPDRGEPKLNRIHLRSGRWIAPGAKDEVIVSESFANANRLGPGSHVSALINGRWRRLRVAGVAISPEYINEVRGGAFPDHRRFGILWAARTDLAAANGLQGAFNDVSIALAPGADEKDVIRRLDRMLARYGSLGAYGRDEQTSNRFIRDEIAQDRVTSLFIPAIFLGVAVFLVHLVLTRVVASQREQIAVLKAFGFGSRTIAAHYVQLALIIAVAGCLAGLPLGYWLGIDLTDMYTEFFKFPHLTFTMSWRAVLLPVGASLAAAALAAAHAVRQAAALPPAVGMRGEPPPRYGRTSWDRSRLMRMVSPPVRMVLRSMLRRPVRTTLSIAGLSMAATILIVGQFSFDALERMIDLYFRRAQCDDATIVFTQPRERIVLADLRRMPGVQRAEGVRTIAVRITSGSRSRRVALIGMEPASQLRNLIGSRGSELALPAGGVVLTEHLANVLGVAPGGFVDITALEGRRPSGRFRVSATLDEGVGINVYTPIELANRFMREPPTITSAMLALDARHAPDVYSRLRRAPAVATVSLREAMLASARDTIIKNVKISTSIIGAFACLIAFAVIYNGARIALSERGRELATLRVLGFRRGEVAAILDGEQALLTLASIPLGCVLGYGLAILVVAMFDSEVYRIPVIVSGRTYAITIGVIAVAALFSAWTVARRVRTLDLVEVLKTRE